MCRIENNIKKCSSYLFEGITIGYIPALYIPMILVCFSDYDQVMLSGLSREWYINFISSMVLFSSVLLVRKLFFCPKRHIKLRG